jgi:ribosomal protein L35AE/L33A
LGRRILYIRAYTSREHAGRIATTHGHAGPFTGVHHPRGL